MAKKWNFGALFVCQESTFNVDPDADGSDYKHVKAAADAAFAPSVAVVERDGLLESMARLAHVMGPKGGTLSFRLEMKGSGTPATSTATEAEAHEILEAVLGAPVVGVGTTVNDNSATASGFTVTSAAGLAVGMMVLVDCGATYGFVPRFVTAIATNAVTLDRALPVAPANAAVVHASTRYARANSGQKSLAFVARRDDILYTFTGCKLDSMAIESVEAGAIAALNMTFSCSSWSTFQKASLPPTVLTGATATRPPVIRGACFAYGGTEKPLYSLSFEFGLATVFQDSTCAQGPGIAETVNAGFLTTQSRPTGSANVYSDAAFMADFATGAEKSLTFAAGGGAGNAWGLYIPRAQLTADGYEDRNGMVGEALTYAVNENGSGVEYALSLA